MRKSPNLDFFTEDEVTLVLTSIYDSLDYQRERIDKLNKDIEFWKANPSENSDMYIRSDIGCANRVSENIDRLESLRDKIIQERNRK